MLLSLSNALKTLLVIVHLFVSMIRKKLYFMRMVSNRVKNLKNTLEILK